MTDNLVCPGCASPLRHRLVGSAGAWGCDACSGLALNLAVLRNRIDPAVATTLWRLARAARASTRPCPSCRRGLRQIDYAFEAGSVEVDVCTVCQLVWFDHGELERFGTVRAVRPAKPQLPRLSARGAREPRVDATDSGTLDGVGDILDLAWDIVASWD